MGGDERLSFYNRYNFGKYTCMALNRRTSHAVYDTKYHLVWAPKYRKWMLRGDVRETAKEIFEEIAVNHGIEIDTLEIAEDHVHLFLSFPPRYSIAKVVGKLKRGLLPIEWVIFDTQSAGNMQVRTLSRRYS